MAQRTKEELRQACIKAFGRNLTDEELDLYGPRLERQLGVIERLRAWENRLGLTEPATVFQLFQ